jgi:penicillin-binding protein 1C
VRGRGVLLAAAPALALVSALVWAARVPFDRAALDYGDVASIEVLARDGTPLRTTLGRAETRAVWTPLSRISPLLVEATLVAEDRRFRAHPGVDPVGVARAAWRNLRAGGITGGGSTLTQQLSGLLWPEPRTPAGKLREAVRAVRLELALSKDEILEQYLNRAPYGSTIQGVMAASEGYFELSPERLGPGQAATLAALPKAPGRFVSAGGAEALRRRRDHILTAMERRGALRPEEAAVARRSPLDLRRAAGAHQAPHFADWVLAERPLSARGAARLTTTLDARLQLGVEAVVRAAQARLAQDGGATQVGVVVQALPSGEVLAMIGSTEWADPAEGQVNAALAPRQPGSALKPFLYAMAFDHGFSAADLLADTPMEAVDAEGASLSPRNFDGRFRGPVRARVALASSFNVPAVRLQERLGTAPVLDGLRAAGLDAFTLGAEHYGLGLTLGVGEVTLLDLTNAYAGLARGGRARPPVFLREARDARGKAMPLDGDEEVRWCDEASAFLVQDILADDAARVPGFGSASAIDLPFPVVVKTGTSTGYRDAWCVGFDANHVVGVWTGNFDGSPARGAAGVRGAGPLFREIMLLLHERGSGAWSACAPPGWRRHAVCALSGDRPGDACPGTVVEWFPDAAWAARAVCAFHRLERGRRVVDWPEEYREWAGDASHSEDEATRPPRITSPADGSVYYFDPSLGDAAAIRVGAINAGSRANWTLDGRRIETGMAEGDSFLLPPVPGEHVLEIEAPGGSDRVRFSVR